MKLYRLNVTAHGEPVCDLCLGRGLGDNPEEYTVAEFFDTQV